MAGIAGPILAALPAFAQTSEQRVALPTAGELWGSKVAIENTPCCAAGSGQTGIVKAEALVLERLSDRAARDGLVLRLKLAGDRSIKITDFPSPGGADYRAHSLVAWWPQQGYYVVRVHHEDGASTFLIREADGLMLLVFGRPMLSPDGRHAVAQAGESFGEIDVVDMRANPPRLLPIDQGPGCIQVGLKTVGTQPKWISNMAVEFGPANFILGHGTALLRIAGNEAEWVCLAGRPGSGERK